MSENILIEFFVLKHFYLCLIRTKATYSND